jgi:two-component system response regulator DesR
MPGALRTNVLEADMIRVLLVEQMNLLRGALATVLSIEDDLLLVGELARVSETVTMAKAVRPDLVVIDIEPVAEESLIAVTELRESLPECGVLLLADTDRSGSLREPFEAHVNGFVGRHVAPAELAQCIRRVVQGERVIDPELAVAALSARRNPLTVREREVLRESASGVPSAEIARRLHLSSGTVRNYLSSIIRKTGSRNRLEAIHIATEQGWL